MATAQQGGLGVSWVQGSGLGVSCLRVQGCEFSVSGLGPRGSKLLCHTPRCCQHSCGGFQELGAGAIIRNAVEWGLHWARLLWKSMS